MTWVMYCPLGVFLDSPKQLDSQDHHWPLLTPAYSERARTRRNNRLPAGQPLELHRGSPFSWPTAQGQAEKLKRTQVEEAPWLESFLPCRNIYWSCRGTACRGSTRGLPSENSHHTQGNPTLGFLSGIHSQSRFSVAVKAHFYHR